ncbi:peptidase inhibitor family I36 protein [Terrabacter sp. LjRoot27]|uniref:peptidase inhibitor family I36 protein n=1 Tax=Terrabacter sp. LjRoot27 TaxID=3342306 RepID=UPI003ED0AB2C
MTTTTRPARAAGAVLALLCSVVATLLTASPAQAATARNGVCESGEFCFYYNSGNVGSISDHAATDLGDYGTDPASCYTFRTSGRNGYGQCIKNNAASVWNRTGKAVRVHYNSDFGGTYQQFAAGAEADLNATLKNNNASHDVEAFVSAESCKNSFGNPRSCSAAVTWAIGMDGKYDSALNDASTYSGLCDRFVANAYGWSHSGSTTAYNHWTQIPSTYRHGGDRSVPAGGLAFFSNGGAGHVMISIGGGYFMSNDIDVNGRIDKTTIATIENRWGQNYLGWAQPYFMANH